MLPAVRDAWVAQSAQVGNPSSLHASGRRARRVVEESRESIAALLGVRPSAVVFTSGGTEADNLAVKGLFWSRQARGRCHARSWRRRSSTTPSSTPCCGWRRSRRRPSTWLPVDPVGRVRRRCRRRRRWPTLTPWPCAPSCGPTTRSGRSSRSHEIAALCREAGVPFHTDAVQALGYLPVDLGALGADAVTISSHKIGGPFGVGRAHRRSPHGAHPRPPRRRPGARGPVGHARRSRHRGLRRRRRAGRDRPA